MRVILKATNIPHNPISHGFMPGFILFEPFRLGREWWDAPINLWQCHSYIYMSLSGSGNCC